MAREFAASFYKSQAWKNCRAAYAKHARHLCEDCLEHGIYRPGEIVHHVIELTPENISCPEVALDFNNLRLLCRDCHAKVHNARLQNRRYVVDRDGKIYGFDNDSMTAR